MTKIDVSALPTSRNGLRPSSARLVVDVGEVESSAQPAERPRPTGRIWVVGAGQPG